MGTIAVTPTELEAAAATLRRAANRLSDSQGRVFGSRTIGDLGSDELDQAVYRLCNKAGGVVASLALTLGEAAAALGGGAGAYSEVDTHAMAPVSLTVKGL